MLSHVQDLGFRVGQFAVEPIEPAEIDRLLAVLKTYYGEDVSQAALVPHEDQAGLREALATAAPTVTGVGAGIRDRLEDGYSGVVVPRLWLDRLDLDTRAAVLFTLTLGMGSPTATDKVDRKIVWDIKALGSRMKAGHVPTYSEHAAEAELHTDTQYYPEPERYLLLYFNRPANCGGGVSQHRDIACMEDQMAKTEDGRWALDLLSRQELPFRIPMTFTTHGAQDEVEVTFARILGTRPHVRFRVDTLRRGLEMFPDHHTADVRKAVAIFTAEMENGERRLDKRCDADNLLVVNNHESLHGRSDFRDLDRHAFRIRVADGVAQDPARVLLQPSAP